MAKNPQTQQPIVDDRHENLDKEDCNIVRRSARVRVSSSKYTISIKNSNSKLIEMPIHEETNQIAEKSKHSDSNQEMDKDLTLAEMKELLIRKKNKGKKLKIWSENEKENTKRLAGNGDMEVMAVEDSDFFDFDKDRIERCFKKGQLWAIYDDDDGMPRHYGLIHEVISVNPFQVKMSWLDLQTHEDSQLISWEKMGFHISCGTFKVARKDIVKLLNIFSHLVESERVARELYCVYPKKGSIWAIYNDKALEMDIESRNSLNRDRRCYDIVVVLSSYSEIHGLSMAYLEKVDGFRAVFKRQKIGHRAIRWIEKDNIRLFSHQIPAKKLSVNEDPNLSGDCWELDPASLPPDLLAIT